MAVVALAAALPRPLIAQTRDDYCGSAPIPGVQRQVGSLPERRYVNRSYGYSLQLPANESIFVAPEGPERGFTLVLSTQPRALIRVDAAYDVFYDITPEGVHRRDVNTLRLHDTLLHEQDSATMLAGEPASRSSFRFTCRGSAEELVHEAVVAVRRREIYRLDLQTTPQRAEVDARLLSALVRSWRWETP